MDVLLCAVVGDADSGEGVGSDGVVAGGDQEVVVVGAVGVETLVLHAWAVWVDS